MTPMNRLQNRLRARPVDKVPNLNIMMVFAARHIRQPLVKYYRDYRILCDANFAVQEDFNLDILQAISDPYRETFDFGARIQFPDDNLPVCTKPLIEHHSDLARLIVPDPGAGERMSDRIKAVARFRERAGGDIPVMGWVEGALAEAATLRGVSRIMLDMYDAQPWLHELLDICCQVGIAFAREQVRNGADIIGLGDAVASQISPGFYRQFALPYEKKIFSAVHDMGALCRLHICGDTTGILHDMAESGADIIDIDWMVDMGRASQAFGRKAAVCGNQDPAGIMLRGTPTAVKKVVEECLQKGGPRCFSAAGCEIPDKTPHENLHAHSRVLFC